MIKRPKGLGRGLDALLGGEPTSPAASPTTLPVARLRPGKYQPRTRMDPQALSELADSIKVQGIMQPILVRPVDSGQYEIIAGERRFRAAQLAGLDEVPVLVKPVPDTAALAMALIENIQREDLNPLEEAQGVQRLIREFDFTHEQAAQAIGRSRSATSQPAAAAEPRGPGAGPCCSTARSTWVTRARLLACRCGHADPARESHRGARPVRAGGRDAGGPRTASRRPAGKSRAGAGRDRDVVRLEEELADCARGHACAWRTNAKGGGRVVIEFSSLDQLDGIVARLRRS